MWRKKGVKIKGFVLRFDHGAEKLTEAMGLTDKDLEEVTTEVVRAFWRYPHLSEVMEYLCQRFKGPKLLAAVYGFGGWMATVKYILKEVHEQEEIDADLIENMFG